MSKMENTKESVCNVNVCRHKEGIHSLTLDLRDRHVSLATNSYPHVRGNYVSISIYDLSPEDILEISNAIRRTVITLKPELNEALMVGAGI